MAGGSKIQWTGETLNPIRARLLAEPSRIGWHCEHASPGCANCYAESLNKAGRSRFTGTRLPYKPGHRKDVEIFLDEKVLARLLSWRKPRAIFWCSMTDLFADFVTDAMLDRCFAAMALTPQHIHQVLTKRSARMRAYLESWRSRRDHWVKVETAGRFHGWVDLGQRPPLPNVWLGVSVEERGFMLERGALLRDTPAACRFWSAEPLLGDLGRIPPEIMPDWIIAGGESGAKARPMHPDWVRSLRDQCAAAGTAFFFKQWGNFAPLAAARPALASSGVVAWPNGRVGSGFAIDDGGPGEQMYRASKAIAGRLLDGVEHNAMPAEAPHG